ncbi:MAG: hypothetical protein IJM61_02905 [Firmicutes bacterium]|nr:hypothetical protein [Bacillota bacterium]
MLKKIRDFIYDINDIFVAIIILLAAAGIIIWRSTAIMAYPEYLASKNPQSNTANVDFSGIDLTPENVENITQNIEIVQPTDPDPNAPADPNQGGTEDPNAQTDPNQGGTQDPNGTADPNQGAAQDPNGTTDPNQGGETTTPPDGGTQTGTQDGAVTATIKVDTWGNGERWPKVADKLVQVGLISSDEKDAFLKTVTDLGLESKLKPGTYELTNTSYEDMIKIICK